MAKINNPLSLKTRWLIFKASVSTPALLARFGEKKIIPIITGLNGGLAILTISLFAWMTSMPLIFPALGPTAFILFSTPLAPAAAPRNIIVGHFSCLAIGWAAWNLTSYLAGIPDGELANSGFIYLSASVALAISCLLLVRINCPHPPACTSCLVVAWGGVTHWLDILLMAAVIVWLTYQAMAMNRMAGLPVPKWSPKQNTGPTI